MATDPIFVVPPTQEARDAAEAYIAYLNNRRHELGVEEDIEFVDPSREFMAGWNAAKYGN
jgi:hypothetical protein